MLVAIGFAASFALAAIAYSAIEKPYMDMADAIAPYRRARAAPDAPVAALQPR